MTKATFNLHAHHHAGPVDPRIFGGFLEHMGRAVYEGIYDPTSAHADEFGCRADVLTALNELDFTVMRYPGGNFVSNYHWRDGVGDVEERPTRRELAWGTIEPNSFGTNEFLSLCNRTGWSPMFAVNLGTGSPEEAADWVEYTNGQFVTDITEQRELDQSSNTPTVPLWCLGNEMDGPWQIGHVSAAEYGTKARQAAHMMKLVDPSIELVVSGTSLPDNETYLNWDREALEAVGGFADYLSTHRYLDNYSGDTAAFLTSGAAIDQQIAEIDSVCRYVAGKRRSSKRPFIAFDEWNVWYRTRNRDGMWAGGNFPAHLVEEVYDLQDALVCAQFLMSFIRNADVVKIANIAQIVNVIAPVLTDGDHLLRQTIFEALAMFVNRREGRSLHLGYHGPTVESPDFGDVAMLDGAVILSDNAELHVYAVNRSVDSTVDLTIDLSGAQLSVVSSELLHHPTPSTQNTWENPHAVRRSAFETSDGAAPLVQLPPHSFFAATFQVT
ncbi:MAG: alpha-N-arabinofuranosidase [Acidimicrobiales bacterium]|nr:MAG: alpha-N-arabinofuranosidase [Acidimicrobiales bacterium]